jgi:predicted transcriptional regulator
MSSPQAVKLDDATKKRLQELGELKDRSPHWLMKTAIEEYVNREEQYERQKQEDFQRWDRYVLTGEVYTHEQVQKIFKDLAAGRAVSWPK